jgi:hypothetical protein
MTQKLVDKVPEKTRWRLRILERNVDNLLNQTADAVAKKEGCKLFLKYEKQDQQVNAIPLKHFRSKLHAGNCDCLEFMYLLYRHK